MKTVFQLGLGAAIFSMTDAIRIYDEISTSKHNLCQEIIGLYVLQYNYTLCDVFSGLEHDYEVSDCKTDCKFQDAEPILPGFETCEDICDARLNMHDDHARIDYCKFAAQQFGERTIDKCSSYEGENVPNDLYEKLVQEMKATARMDIVEIFYWYSMFGENNFEIDSAPAWAYVNPNP